MLKNNTRPFLLVFPLLIIGIYLSQFQEYAAFMALFASAASLLWLYLEYRGQPHAEKIFWVLLVCAGYFLGILDIGYLPESESTATITGEVVSVRRLTYNQRVIVQSPELRAKLAVQLPLEAEVAPGLRLSMRGRVVRPDSARIPGEFNYRQFLRGQGVYAVIELEEFEVLAEKNWVRVLIADLREYVRANLNKNMRSPQLLTALILGDRHELTPEQENLWQQLGITHLLAVSGMHISLLASVLWMVVQAVPAPPAVKRLLVAAILLNYVFLSGSQPSAWRAWLSALFAGAGSERHRLDGLHVWSLVGVLMLVVSPSMLWQIGFQLSFAASGGIILWSPFIKRVEQKFPKGWFSGFAARACLSIFISVIAQLSLIPLLLHHFAEVAVLAPIATLLMLPLVFLLLLGGLVLGAFGSLAAPVGWFLDRVTNAANWLADTLSPYGYVITAPALPFDWVLVWYISFIGVGIICRRYYIALGKVTLTRWLCIGLALVLVVSLPLPVRRPLEITFLDVGQGDCILIRTPYKQHILIDGGGDSVYWQLRGRNVGLETVVPYLKYRGIDHLDLVMLSHPHEDHLHGLLAVLEHFSVGLVVDNGQPHTTNTYLKYLELIETQDIPHRSLTAGDQLHLRGGVKLTVLHPSRLVTGTSSDFNNNSLVVNLNYQGRNVLFTGDLDWEGMLDLLQRGEIHSVDLVKVPHHGSKAALLPRFYQLLDPDYAVITVGKNSFGHPDPDVLALLDEMGIKTKRTDQDGTVSFFIWNGRLGRFFSAR